MPKVAEDDFEYEGKINCIREFPELFRKDHCMLPVGNHGGIRYIYWGRNHFNLGG